MAAKSNLIEVNLDSSSPETVRTGTLVVGAFVDSPLSPATKAIDQAAKGKLSA